MTKAVHASNIPSDLPRSPLQPGLSGDLAQDRDAFAAFWSQCDELRLRFPPKPSRTAAEATACAAIFAAERKAREEFLQLHVDEVYNKFTCYSREFIRAEQLVADAALAFPGLVPTQAVIARDNGPMVPLRGIEPLFQP